MVEELNLLKEFCSKYGSHRLRKYLGVAFKDIAADMGVTPVYLSAILGGRGHLSEKSETLLQVSFLKRDLKAKIDGFTETESQTAFRELMTSIRKGINRLTIIVIGCILSLAMKGLFLNSNETMFPEYSASHRRNSIVFHKSLKAAHEFHSWVAFFIVNTHTTIA